MKNKEFIEGAPETGLATPDLETMIVNEDGSVDIYFSPEPPDGQESNWITTGEDWFVLFRLYGPKEGWIDSGWRLPEFEKIE